MMEVIRDKDGNAIQESRNLRGIREYVSDHLIKVLDVCPVGKGEGQLSILFDDGSSFQTNFASYTVLCGFVKQWRNVYGAPLTIGGVPNGVCSARAFEGKVCEY